MATKKKVAKKSLPATKKFNGKVYKKSSCSRLKGEAKKKAERLRKSGKAARVVKNPTGGHCVFVRGTAKKK